MRWSHIPRYFAHVRFPHPHIHLVWECNLRHLQKLFLENPLPLCVASWPAKKNAWMRSWPSLRSRWLGMGQILSHPDSANLVNKELLYSENKIFSRGTKRAIPSGQARAANRNVGFASSSACPPVEPALEQILIYCIYSAIIKFWTLRVGAY